MPEQLKKVISCDKCHKAFEMSKMRIEFLLDGYGSMENADFVIFSNTFIHSPSSGKLCTQCYVQEFKSKFTPMMQEGLTSESRTKD
jgi:hypothetical protein